MNNPYAATVIGENAPDRTRSMSVTVSAVAVALLTSLTILLESWLVVFPVTYFLATTIRDTPNFSPAMISGWEYIALGLLVFVTHWFILCGAICMWRNTNRRLAALAMLLAIVPVLSPLFVIGIPFGIWGSIALRRAFSSTPRPSSHGITMA